MFERFTDRARKVMALANQEAIRLNHEYIGTEHILLGLVKEGTGVGASVLKNMNIDLRAVDADVRKLIKAGPNAPVANKLPQTPRAKKTVEYAIAEARELGHNYVGTEHLLLALLSQNTGVAEQVLMNCGLTLKSVRVGVLELLGPLNESIEPGSTSVSAICSAGSPPPAATTRPSTCDPNAMRFTDHARKVMALANQEAQRFGHEAIGTEHVLLGLAKEGSGVAARALKSLGADLRQIRLGVEKLVKPGDKLPDGVLSQTDEAKRVVEQSIQEAKSLGHQHVGTEHLLLGLLHDSQTIACRVLIDAGLKLDRVREEVHSMINAGIKDDSPAALPTAATAAPATEAAPAAPLPIACDLSALFRHAAAAAAASGSPHIMSEHLLVALLSIGDERAGWALNLAGTTPEKVREAVTKMGN